MDFRRSGVIMAWMNAPFRLPVVLTILFKCLLLIFSARISTGAAPSSLDDKVFFVRDMRNPTPFGFPDTTYLLYTDGSYLRLKDDEIPYSGGIPVFAPSKIFVSPSGGSAPAGTFTYNRTNDSIGVLTFTGPAGGSTNFTLNFGSQSFSSGGGFGTFQIRELSSYREAALANVSVKGRVSSGQSLTCGFVVRRTGQEVLVRVVGSSLSSFGSPLFWAQPRYSLYPQFPTAPVTGPWRDSSALQSLFAFLGAFPLKSGSNDLANVYSLARGAYTIVCDAPAGDPGGDVLVEVYVLP